MFKRLSQIMGELHLNEYIERFTEIKAHLDAACELPIEEVKIVNDGCDDYLVRKCVGYLENHGIRVYGF